MEKLKKHKTIIIYILKSSKKKIVDLHRDFFKRFSFFRKTSLKKKKVILLLSIPQSPYIITFF